MPLLLNREFRLPQDGWFQVAPKGEHPHAAHGVTQVVDDAACSAMVRSFDSIRNARGESFGGLLVDFDHFSLDTGKPSEAAGWIVALENRADGLYARIRWSDVGEQAVRGGRYRYISPVWNRSDCEAIGPNRLRPLALLNAALTNDPNIAAMVPLTNRTLTDGSGAAGRIANEGTPTMTKILKALNLPETATEDDVVAAIAALSKSKDDMAVAMENQKAECGSLKNRAEKAEGELLAAKVEGDLVEFADVISNRDAVRSALIANRDSTRTLLAALRKPSTTPRTQGVIPQMTETAKAQQAISDGIAAIRNRRPSLTHTQAHTILRMERPELFAAVG